jgi:undecaprenyl-diphosphatase
MTFFDAFLFGALQGITEFLPVSSSAHVAICAQLSGLPCPGGEFGVFINAGSLLAILVVLHRQVLDIGRGGIDFICGRKTAARSFFLMFALSSLPVMAVYAVGTALRIRIESVKVLSVLLIVFGVVLYLCDRSRIRKRNISAGDSMLTGLAQSLSFIPGVSRLGICMSAMRYLGYSREDSFRYSIMLYIPPVSAACCAQLAKNIVEGTGENVSMGLIGLTSSFVFGVIFLPQVLKFLQKHNLLPIVIYRILFGALLLARETGIISLF